MFKKVTVELIPPVSGVLTKNGKPQEGIKITRGYEYIGVTEGEVYDYTVTDEEGHFHFPELTMESRYPSNPLAVNVIWQGIFIENNSQQDKKDTYLWNANSRGITHDKYFTEMLSTLNCEITNTQHTIDIVDSSYPDGIINHPIVSICRWPEREEIERRKWSDIDKFGELQDLNSYGHINGLI